MRLNALLIALSSSAAFVAYGAPMKSSSKNALSTWETGKTKLGKKIECTLTSTKGSKESHAEISLDADSDESVVSNDWIYVRKNESGQKVKYNYRIWLSISRDENDKRQLELMLDEEYVLQDEIGSKTCEIPESDEAFCQEPFEAGGQVIAKIVCHRKS